MRAALVASRVVGRLRGQDRSGAPLLEELSGRDASRTKCRLIYLIFVTDLEPRREFRRSSNSPAEFFSFGCSSRHVSRRSSASHQPMRSSRTTACVSGNSSTFAASRSRGWKNLRAAEVSRPIGRGVALRVPPPDPMSFTCALKDSFPRRGCGGDLRCDECRPSWVALGRRHYMW
jgi:hypothetical protein